MRQTSCYTEAVSVIRQGIFDHWITEAEGLIAIEDLFRLGMEIVPSDVELCQAAMAWAEPAGAVESVTMDFIWPWRNERGQSCGPLMKDCATRHSS